jgi:DNA-binding beta-propeller fold protein YncE
MRGLIMRAAVACAAGAAFSAIGLAGAGAASPLTVSGARVWVQRYNGLGNGDDSASAVAVSRDGKTLYVTGTSQGAGTGLDYATLAYRAATGTQVWAARYNGPANGDDSASAVAVSPDGKQLYVTGTSSGVYATVAYDTATGAQLWVVRHHGPGQANAVSSAIAVAVSPDNNTVFVTGTTQNGDSSVCGDKAYDTIAYSASTGLQLWDEEFCNFSSAGALAVSPDGRRVYVTGQFDNECGVCSLYGTVAYNAATGHLIWQKFYGSPGAQAGTGSAIAVSRNGGRVYVSGSITRTNGGTDYGTIAYSSSGRRLWLRRYRTPGGGLENDLVRSLAVSPAGTVVVTGYSPRATSGSDYATVAYSPAGKQLWAKLYSGPSKGANIATSVAAPGNGKVYVTGTSMGAASHGDYATIAYNILTGARLWVRRYDGPANGNNQASSLTVGAGKVFVTGGSQGTTSGLDYATIAYRG